MFKGLGFNDLIEPGVKVEISTAFYEVFELYARIVKPEGGGEKVYAFDAYCLSEFMCRTWTEIYGTVATSREEVSHDKCLLNQEIQKLTNREDGRVKKLVG